MKTVILNTSIAIVALTAGLWFGYSTALNNQAYFDAPAKLSLYGSILEQGKSSEYLRGQMIKQVQILDSAPAGTSKLLLNMPIHHDVRDSYMEIGGKITESKHYVETKRLLSTYNKSLNQDAQ